MWWALFIGLSFLLLCFILQKINFTRRKSYRLLVSAQCRDYQDWQALGVLWSAKKNWPSVKYTRLLSCAPEKRNSYKYRHIVPSFLTNDWATHPTTGDDYAPYNRPLAIKEYLEQVLPNEEWMVIVDPDVIIRKPMNSIPVAKGKPVAQLYEYMHNDDALKKLAKKWSINSAQPIGMPMIIHRDDLARVAPVWLDFTEKIRQDPETRDLSGWIAEMHAYALACASLGLKHTIRNDLADRTPYSAVRDPYLLHYDLPHEHREYKWNKRDYYQRDMLDTHEEMPEPSSAPNERFRQVTKTINDALRKCRKLGFGPNKRAQGKG